MKYSIIVLICFSLLLTSCSSNQVTLRMRDGVKIESELLSVRDSSIVIQEKGGAPIVIRNEDVDSVLYDAGSSLPYTIVGAVAVGTLGVGLSTLDFNSPPKYDEPALVISGALIGGALGWVIGGLVSPDDKIFKVNKWEDRYAMISYSKYLSSEEPDELKKIQ